MVFSIKWGDLMEKDLEKLKSIEKKIDLLLKKKGKDRFDLLDAFAEAFFIYHEHQLFERGLYYAERLVELLESDGEVTEDLLLAWSNLSVFALKTGDEERSMELIGKVMGHRADGKGPESKEALESRIFNANLKVAAGDVHEAIELFSENIEECRKFYAIDSPEMAISHESLAALYCNLSAFDMAESLLERYLEELSQVTEETNLGYLECLRMLSDAYELEGDSKSALIYRKERARISKNLPDREYYYEAAIALGNTRVIEGSEIYSAIEDLIFIQNEMIVSPGTNDDLLEKAVSVLAECTLSIKDYQKASDCLYYIYSRALTKYGDGSAEARNAASRLSYVYSLDGEFDKSIDICRKSYLATLRSEGILSKATSSIMIELGQAYREAGRFDDAISSFKSIINNKKNLSIICEEEVQDSALELASLYMEIGEYKEAAALYQELIKKQKKQYGLVDEFVAELMILLSECYLKRNSKGDRKRAEKELNIALEILLIVQGVDSDLTIKCRDLIESL